MEIEVTKESVVRGHRIYNEVWQSVIESAYCQGSTQICQEENILLNTRRLLLTTRMIDNFRWQRIMPMITLLKLGCSFKHGVIIESVDSTLKWTNSKQVCSQLSSKSSFLPKKLSRGASGMRRKRKRKRKRKTGKGRQRSTKLGADCRVYKSSVAIEFKRRYCL